LLKPERRRDMPYVSEKQRKFMYSQHPEIAARWDAEGKNYIEKKKKKTFQDHMKDMIKK
jgi:hypothetical protein